MRESASNADELTGREIAGDQGTRPQRVVIIASYGPSLVNFRGPLLKAIRKLGHEVICIAPSISGETRRALNELGASYHTIPMTRARVSPRKDAQALFALWRLLRELRPDVVLSYTLKPVIYGSVAARFAGVPKIHSMITGLGWAFSGDSKRQRRLRAVLVPLLRIALRGNKSVVFQNKQDVQDLRVARGLPEAVETFVVPGSGVDLDHFTPAPIPRSPMTFLFVGRLLRAKGVPEFIEAARIVRSNHPGVRFRVVGPYDQSPDGMSPGEVDEAVRSGTIDYPGATSDVRSHLREASVLVLPSRYREGLSRSLLEGMATGRPIITTDAPGCRELVRPDENGLLVPPSDPNALAGACLHLAQNPQLLPAMGRAGRQLAEEQYGASEVAAETLRAIGLEG